MVESSTANDSPLYRILLPYCPRDVVREITNRSLWYREHDTLRWRDAEFQANINLFLKEDCGEIAYQHVNIFENEVSLHVSERCTVCRDNLCHIFSASKCMEYEETSTRLNDLHSFQISGEYLQKYPVILVGAQVYTHKSLTGKFPVLNLSDTTRNIQYATGISGGIPVVFNTRENGNHTKTFKDYFQTLKAVAGLLSPKNSTLILCEFFLLEGTNPDSKVEIFLQAMAFLSELVKIRKHSKGNFTVLCPLPKHHQDGTQENYLRSYKLAMYAQTIMTLCCSKLHIPVCPLYGEITAVSLHTIAFGPWSQGKDQCAEPLYNHRGSPTREFKKRFGRVIDKITLAWVKTIRELPHLRNNYYDNTGKGFHRYHPDICPIKGNSPCFHNSLESAEEDEESYDTVC